MFTCFGKDYRALTVTIKEKAFCFIVVYAANDSRKETEFFSQSSCFVTLMQIVLTSDWNAVFDPDSDCGVIGKVLTFFWKLKN